MDVVTIEILWAEAKQFHPLSPSKRLWQQCNGNSDKICVYGIVTETCGRTVENRRRAEHDRWRLWARENWPVCVETFAGLGAIGVEQMISDARRTIVELGWCRRDGGRTCPWVEHQNVFLRARRAHVVGVENECRLKRDRESERSERQGLTRRKVKKCFNRVIEHTHNHSFFHCTSNCST
jgi:hypothetical protein